VSGLLYRWIGVGRMPAVVRDEIAGEPFPSRELFFPVDPQRVVRLWGSRSKLPD
jgi:hypothetical protein